MKIYIRTRHIILQNLQTHHDLHTNPTRYFTKSTNLWRYTRVRPAYSTKSSNLWRPTHESCKLFYNIFKPMMLYIRTQHTFLRNQLHYIVEFKLKLIKINKTRFSKFNVLTTILLKILKSCLIHSAVCLSTGPQRVFQTECTGTISPWNSSIYSYMWRHRRYHRLYNIALDYG